MLISAAETCYQSLAVEKSIQALIRNQLQKSQVVVIYSKVTLNRVFVHKVAKKKKAWRVQLQIRAIYWEEHLQLVAGRLPPACKTEFHPAATQVRHILYIWISVFTLHYI